MWIIEESRQIWLGQEPKYLLRHPCYLLSTVPKLASKAPQLIFFLCLFQIICLLNLKPCSLNSSPNVLLITNHIKMGHPCSFFSANILLSVLQHGTLEFIDCIFLCQISFGNPCFYHLAKILVGSEFCIHEHSKVNNYSEVNV